MNPFLDIFSTLLGIVLMAGFFWFIWRLWTAPGRREEEARQEPRCDKCGYDLRGSEARCPECGAIYVDRRRYLLSLANDWPDNPIQPRRPDPGEQLVLLLSAQDSREAQMLHEQLMARGIAAFIELGDWVGDAKFKQRFCRIMVYSGDEELARNYLCRAQGVPRQMLDEVRSLQIGERVQGSL
jgi:hypothetical protein